MTDFDIQPYQWALFGGVLICLGLIFKAILIRSIGTGALITGAASWGLEYATLTYQIVLWVGCSFLAWRGAHRGISYDDRASHAGRKRFGLGVLGRVATVSTAIQDGKGKVIIDDQEWNAMGPDLPVGTLVKVTSIEHDEVKVRPRRHDCHDDTLLFEDEA